MPDRVKNQQTDIKNRINNCANEDNKQYQTIKTLK